jgi:hypothetical protein
MIFQSDLTLQKFKTFGEFFVSADLQAISFDMRSLL